MNLDRPGGESIGVACHAPGREPQLSPAALPAKIRSTMCGILGMIGERWAADFEPALDCMAHRGPDDRGVWHQPDHHVRLGHRRLSIIDLSPAGHQPMTTPDGRHTIIFNGEIYNFPELREQLTGLGCAFRSHCDTEVLLQAYAQWGLDALRRLDGMFAFAIWDREERTLIAARDRFGIKPLFYSTADGLIVSSTMSPYWKLSGFPRNVDYRGLRDYLASQSVPAPRTILRHVHAVEPGQYMVYHADDGRVELEH